MQETFFRLLISKTAAVSEGRAGVWGASWQAHPEICALFIGEISLHSYILQMIRKVPAF